jgi:hypothetical protein
VSLVNIGGYMMDKEEIREALAFKLFVPLGMDPNRLKDVEVWPGEMAGAEGMTGVRFICDPPLNDEEHVAIMRVARAWHKADNAKHMPQYIEEV